MDLSQEHNAKAQTLMASLSKRALTKLAREHGWKGDDARTPMLEIALYCAAKGLDESSTAPEASTEQQQNGAREISARFPGKCAHCSGAIQKGEAIYYVKATHSPYHPACYSSAQHGAASAENSDTAPEVERSAEPTKAPTTATPAAMIAEALRQMLAAMPAPMDEERVKVIAGDVAVAVARDSEERMREAMAQLQGREVKIVVTPQGEVRIDEHTHPVFEKCVKLASAGQSIMLKGPAGCGKSHLAAQIAKALGKDYGALHCSAGASESQLLGWLLPTGEGGRFEYIAAQFARMFAAGNALFLIDEIDAADPNFLMVLNGALANGHLHVPQNWTRPSVDRGEGFAVMAAANTYGTGADALYVGRNQLDAATLDRFYVVEMDYDRKLESKLAPADVCAWAWKLRERTAETKLRRVVSTRTIQRVAAALGAGFDMKEAKRDALLGWTRDELAKVGEA